MSEPIDIDPDHPWVQASLNMRPVPMPTFFGLEPVTFEGSDKSETHLGMFSFSTPSGTGTLFFNEQALDGLIHNAVEVRKLIRKRNQEQGPKLHVAGQAEQRQAVAEMVAAERLRTDGG